MLPRGFQIKRIIPADFKMFLTISIWLFVEFSNIHSPSMHQTITNNEKCQMLLMDLDPFLNGSCSVCSPAEAVLLNKAQSIFTLPEQWPSSP